MKNRFQFSVGALLLITTLVSVVFWLTYRVPYSVGVPALTLLTVILPAFLAITAIYGTKGMRPFCIGALFPMCASFLNIGATIAVNWKTFQATPQPDTTLDPTLTAAIGDNMNFNDSDQGFMGLAIITAIVVGFLCSLLHWWLTRNDRGQAVVTLDASDRQSARIAA